MIVYIVLREHHDPDRIAIGIFLSELESRDAISKDIRVDNDDIISYRIEEREIGSTKDPSSLVEIRMQGDTTLTEIKIDRCNPDDLPDI